MDLHIFFESRRRIHFIGIGGVSMHSLAEFFVGRGHHVTGSDRVCSPYFAHLAESGVSTQVGHTPDLIHGSDVVVYNGAISANNAEMAYARCNGIPTIDRAKILGYLCSLFPLTIAVAGTHGKTTTCAMIYHILKTAGLDVSCHIGGDIADARLRYDDDILVVEACEYNHSFLHLRANIAVITNVELDHIDSYANISALRAAFETFSLSSDTTLLSLDPSVSYLGGGSTEHIDVIYGAYSTTFTYRCVQYTLPLLGMHNVHNAICAIRAALYIGVDTDIISRALADFCSVARRCEMIGQLSGIPVYSDYAHHPTEILSFLESMTRRHSRSLTIFQPHTFSRTATLFDEFLACFEHASSLIIYKEYAARESAHQGKSAHELYLRLRHSPLPLYADEVSVLDDIIFSHISSNTPPQAIYYIGAGDIDAVARRTISKYAKKQLTHGPV